MELRTHEKAVFFLPINILSVVASFFGRTTHYHVPSYASTVGDNSHSSGLKNWE